MDFKTHTELRRTSAKALMTCLLCSQYFDDPRLLPCGHTFCRRCLQKYFDLKQAGSTIRVGRINCPKCKTIIGIPINGVEGFPTDTKISRIKDLVINELAEDISKNYQSHSQSDTLSSHSDRTDSGDFGEIVDDTSPKQSNSSDSRSRYARSDTMSDGTASSGSFASNPLYRNMTKYAKYFVKDDESASSEGYKPHFRPAVRAERHRVGYSSSFQHRRRRLHVEPPKGFDDAADILRQSKYGSAPHISRDSSSNVSSSYNDIFGQMPQSSEDFTSSHNLSSRISGNFEATREHRYPGSSSKFPNDEFSEATASMPSLSKTRGEHASGFDPGMAHSGIRNTFSEPKFNHSSGIKETNYASTNGSDAYRKNSSKVPESKRKNSDEINGRSGSSNERIENIPNVSFMEKESTQYSSSANEMPRNSLRTHRENIVTSSTNENERPSFGVKFQEGPDSSRSKSSTRPTSDYYSDKQNFSRTEAKHEPASYERKTNTSSSTRSFTPRSPLVGRSRLSTASSDGLYNECKAEEYQDKATLEKEKVSGWYQDFPESKKFDEKFTRTKPDEIKMQNIFQNKQSPSFHKSASFSTNHWQESEQDDVRNGNFLRSARRKTYYKNINGSSSTGNLNQMDISIKFELKKGKKSKKNLSERRNDQNEIDSEEERKSEMEQRNAFNERILNMRMNKYRYENIMSDFKNGNLCSEINLNEAIDDVNPTEDDTEKTTCEGEVISEPSGTLIEDSSKSPEGSSIDAQNSKTNAENGVTGSEISNVTKEKPVPEEVGHKLKEMIETMRAKYQAVDVDQSYAAESVILQPSCSDGVFPKWNFQKTEFVIPTAIAITSKGCTVVADYGNSCLEFFDSDGNYEHKIDGVKPFCIVANKLDQIIVGDRKGKAIRIFDEYGGDVAQWEAGLFGWISGIAILPNGNVVVHDRDRCKVGIYSSCGEKINEFASYGVHDYQLCMADFVTADSKNRIIVADSGNHCLKIFDTNGKFISKVSGRGTEDGCLEWPKGVCVDSMDNIIVADSQNNRVSMFSATGQFIQHLITTSPSPYSVCYSPLAKLFGVTHYALTGYSQYDVYQCIQ